MTNGLTYYCGRLCGCARRLPEFDLCWRELAIVAKALADGRDMTEIGLCMISPNGPLQSLARATTFSWLAAL